ncbi:MAG: hypothetical protein KAT06_04220 [Gammaproteobacteria bacterium]|nr:hypothetical protein [Gammaproteobacteria bacterium]
MHVSAQISVSLIYLNPVRQAISKPQRFFAANCGRQRSLYQGCVDIRYGFTINNVGAAFYHSLGIDSQHQLGGIQKTYEIYIGIFFSKDETINYWFNKLTKKNSEQGLDIAYKQIRSRYHELWLEVGITSEDMKTIISFEPINVLDADVTKSCLR